MNPHSTAILIFSLKTICLSKKKISGNKAIHANHPHPIGCWDKPINKAEKKINKYFIYFESRYSCNIIAADNSSILPLL